MSHRRRAFTLLEILVVIAIIATLIAILLPALSGSRANSRTVSCLTRLRQLSHGWHMYADDHDEIIVPGRYGNLGGGTGNPANWYDVGNGMKYRPRWIATLGKYVGIHAFDNPSTSIDRQDYDNNVYQCPEVPERMDERNHAFGYNYQFLGNARILPSGKYRNFPVNRSHISSFGGTVMAADCIGTAAGTAPADRLPYENGGTSFTALGNHGWTLDPPRLLTSSDHGSGDPGSPRTAVDPRHLAKSNVVFCDGHAESSNPQTLGYRLNPDGSFAEGGEPTPGGPTNSLFSGSSKDESPPEGS